MAKLSYQWTSVYKVHELYYAKRKKLLNRILFHNYADESIHQIWFGIKKNHRKLNEMLLYLLCKIRKKDSDG
uniref:Uncharacterized protein n=1 Tax=Lepeophtheirus salmonis TaxID=72036 RepID=A0A0K2UAY6_LEPSM